VDDLVDHLEAQGYMADRLHGDMTQNMRDRVMNKFRKSGLEFLVATDIAARGIDVDNVEVVFNYDLPYDVEDYVHRIGRTGRVGRSGRAISFVSGRELFQIRNIERYSNARIQRARVPSEAEVKEARENVFTDKLRALLKSGEFKRQDQLIERLLEEGFTSTDIASACLAQLQSGEAAPAHPPRTAEYDRPERQERGNYQDSRPRMRSDDRRAPRGESRERFERPQRFAERREVRPPRVAAPVAKLPRPEKPPASGAPVPAVPAPVKVVPATDAAVKPEVEKTFSDEEILASVKPESREPIKPASEKPAAKSKSSRATPPGQTRLWMNLGEMQGIVPIDIVNAIAGETGLPGKVVGAVDVRERHLFVDVASEHASGIIAKLKRTQIKGTKVKVKVA
jgi:ATP-dependent RNA helicase DeaD